MKIFIVFDTESYDDNYSKKEIYCIRSNKEDAKKIAEAIRGEYEEFEIDANKMDNFTHQASVWFQDWNHENQVREVIFPVQHFSKFGRNDGVSAYGTSAEDAVKNAKAYRQQILNSFKEK